MIRHGLFHGDPVDGGEIVKNANLFGQERGGPDVAEVEIEAGVVIGIGVARRNCAAAVKARAVEQQVLRAAQGLRASRPTKLRPRRAPSAPSSFRTGRGLRHR